MTVVRLHVERLVLEGFAPAELGSGARVADGVERELRRLVAEALPASWRRGEASAPARAPELRLPASAAPERLGEAIAAAVHRALVPGVGS